MLHDIKNILKGFVLPGKFVMGSVNLTGLINTTYTVIWRGETDKKYVLQRINTRVFTRPVEVMENIETILKHQAIRIREDMTHPDPERGVLTLVPALDGKSCFIDPKGGYWRLYHFVERTRIFNMAETVSQAYEAARMFGRFGRYLSDLDPGLIHYTIPDFHNIGKRFAALKESVTGDIAEREKACGPEIAFALNREYLTEPVTGLLAGGKIPVRVTHNDTKINNVLVDEKTEKGLCVIDLDTVMPGTILSDFGDMVRTFTSTLPEDDPHIPDVAMRLDIFRALAEGYLREAGTFLLPVEKEHLVYGGKLITLMQGIRNLTDYLNGDIYYRTDYTDHNLHRTQNQFALLRSMEEQEEEMERIIAGI